MNIHLTFTGPSVLIIPITIGMIVFLFWAYRHTVPPLKRSVRLILGLFRGTVLGLLAVLLFGPVLRISLSEDVPPDVALLLDHSGSMQLPETDGRRGEKLLGFLRSPTLERLSNGASIHPYLFSDRLTPLPEGLPDSLLFDGAATDIARSLRMLFEMVDDIPFRSALLISDGANNLGEDPVRIGGLSPFPLYTLTVGKARKKPDIIVTNILSNDIAYQGDEVPVEVVVRGPEFAGERITLMLKHADDVLDRTEVTLPPDGMERSTHLRFVPNTPGLYSLAVEASRLEGELTFENNTRDLYIRVLESKIDVFFIADRPNPDVSFLTRILRSDENIALTTRTRRADAGFYEGPFPEGGTAGAFDLLFCLDFPSPETPEPLWSAVRDLIENHRLPMFLVAGRHFQLSRFAGIEHLIPVTGLRKRHEQLVLPKLTPEGAAHSVFSILDNPYANMNAWHLLPPLFVCSRPAGIKPDSRLWLEGVPEGIVTLESAAAPLVISRDLGGRKTLLVLGYGLYRWDLLAESVGGTNEILKGFLSKSMRWLVTREEQERVRLSTSKMSYRAGEDVDFIVQVYDEMYRPLERAVVNMIVESGGQTRSFRLDEAGSGRYRSRQRFFNPGSVNIEVEAFLDEVRLGRDELDLFITASGREYLSTESDPGLMETLAAVTGGQAGPVDSAEVIIGRMDLNPERRVRIRETVLARDPLLLAVLMILLAAEWFIRRRRGMD